MIRIKGKGPSGLLAQPARTICFLLSLHQPGKLCWKASLWLEVVQLEVMIILIAAVYQHPLYLVSFTYTTLLSGRYPVSEEET